MHLWQALACLDQYIGAEQLDDAGREADGKPLALGAAEAGDLASRILDGAQYLARSFV